MNEIIVLMMTGVLAQQPILATIWIVISGVCIGLFLYIYMLVLKHRK